MLSGATQGNIYVYARQPASSLHRNFDLVGPRRQAQTMSCNNHPRTAVRMIPNDSVGRSTRNHHCRWLSREGFSSQRNACPSQFHPGSNFRRPQPYFIRTELLSNYLLMQTELFLFTIMHAVAANPGGPVQLLEADFLAASRYWMERDN